MLKLFFQVSNVRMKKIDDRGSRHTHAHLLLTKTIRISLSCFLPLSLSLTQISPYKLISLFFFIASPPSHSFSFTHAKICACRQLHTPHYLSHTQSHTLSFSSFLFYVKSCSLSTVKVSSLTFPAISSKHLSKNNDKKL